jgi:hypothetical protein
MAEIGDSVKTAPVQNLGGSNAVLIVGNKTVMVMACGA